MSRVTVPIARRSIDIDYAKQYSGCRLSFGKDLHFAPTIFSDACRIDMFVRCEGQYGRGDARSPASAPVKQDDQN